MPKFERQLSRFYAGLKKLEFNLTLELCVFDIRLSNSNKNFRIDDFPLENLRNIISFTRLLGKICTIHHYTEKNGTGATLKWKRGLIELICGRKGRNKGFSAFMQQVPYCLKPQAVRW